METLSIEDPVWGTIQIKRWFGLHFKQAADIPMEIILFQRKGVKLSIDAATKPIWLACIIEQIPTLEQIWSLYSFFSTL